ncbi:MAG: hypothetical protein N3A65_08925 [candidate division WOR-3 bacterium]|nr:hypothetical protein [candidate division WOR-3 bacterium]
MLIVSCDNFIIERSASDYFPMEEGNWWFYSNDDLYDPKSINITVEPVDTILERECFPFNVSGEFRFYSKDVEGIKEYIKITENYGGNELTILQGFITRLELPLVSGNRFTDSLTDSLDFYGRWIKVRYVIYGFVSDYYEDRIYGGVYKVIINKRQTIAVEDSVILKEEYLEEHYAPGIGMIEFRNAQGIFRIKDFHLE